MNRNDTISFIATPGAVHPIPAVPASLDRPVLDADVDRMVAKIEAERALRNLFRARLGRPLTSLERMVSRIERRMRESAK